MQEIPSRGNEEDQMNTYQETQQKSPEFKNWFGDWEIAPEQASKVVDEQGKPLIVYRGGTQQRYEYFNDIPACFTKSKEYAKWYGSGVVNEVYIDIKNPYEFSYDLDLAPRNKYYITPDEFIESLDLDPKNDEKLKKLRMDLIKCVGGEEEEAEPYIYVARKSFRDYLQEKGFEGITPKEKGEDIYSPLSPKYAIKSATDNSGAFSRTNPDIRN